MWIMVFVCRSKLTLCQTSLECMISLPANAMNAVATLSQLKIKFAFRVESELDAISHIIEKICKSYRLRVILISFLKDESTLSRII